MFSWVLARPPCSALPKLIQKARNMKNEALLTTRA
jgi:hypothetical protein